MSLIGIWGHSAIGKTYWLHSIKDDLKAIQPKIVIACADDVTEYHPYSKGWIARRQQHWKSTKDDRIQTIHRIVKDDKIWIVDSMRWFIGMQPELINAFNMNCMSGLHMIVVWSQPDVQRDFRLKRTVLLGKPWNVYWDDQAHLKVEANRGINSIAKHFEPGHVPWATFEIDAQRKNWAQVTAYLKTILEWGDV